ncbi:hypothetical protein ACIP88_14655 [Streptomyces uncialis]|uniref:hypothetical protein n=1 Tax=Streptomyces uncialis TaxID=1048205 RepID=UPI0037FC8031
MSTLTWVLLIVLVPVALVVVGFGLYMLKAVVQGALEGWRSGKEEDDDAYESPDEVLAQGFLPMERQNTDRREADSPERSRALAAVKGGDWRAAAALMDAAGRDWQARTDLTYQLGGLAADDDSWLLAWENERPDDPTAALLRARSTVDLAWNIRGSKRAKYTTGEQFEGFHRTLARSREEHARAAALAPEDPTPYISELDTAKGLGYPNAEVDRLWDEIVARAPHHFMAHYSALQYWCKKWGGSESLARDFAARAAESAPLGQSADGAAAVRALRARRVGGHRGGPHPPDAGAGRRGPRGRGGGRPGASPAVRGAAHPGVLSVAPGPRQGGDGAVPAGGRACRGRPVELPG